MWGYVLIALISVQRIAEIWLSNSNGKYLMKRGAHVVANDGMRKLAMLHTAFLLALLAEYTLTASYRLPIWLLPFVAFVCAQGLRYWSIRSLGRRWNIRVYILPGSAPIARGPYRFLRHPNYLAVAIEILCLPLCLHAYVTALVFTVANAWVVAQRIAIEEHALCNETPYDGAMGSLPRGVWSVRRDRRP